REGNHHRRLAWHLLPLVPHQRLKQWVRDLNRLYRAEPALHVGDCRAEGFEWIDSGDAANSVLSFLRRGGDGGTIVVVCNFTPMPRHNYRVGVPGGGFWREVLNSDAICYGGSGQGKLGCIDAGPTGGAGGFHSINATLPPPGVPVLTGR